MFATPRLARLAGRRVFPARALPDSAYDTDLHLHTDYTDGRSTIAEMLAAASAAGLAAVAFTEHVRRGADWFPGFYDEVQRQAEAFSGLDVLIGIEAKALDEEGALDADWPLIERAELVLGAFHNYPDGRGGFCDPAELSAREAALCEFRASWGLLAHPDVDVLAHPGALTRRRFGEFPDAYTRQLVRKAVRERKAIELNGEYATPADLSRMLAWCREEDAWVTLGSNAHHASEVGRIGRMVQEAFCHAC
ncbi:MAG TPA: PHP domain-containing protein [Oscillatoriaceae cyanobacterium]